MIYKKLLVLLLGVFWGSLSLMAQKSELHQRAESEYAKHHIANARSLYIRAYEGYVGKNQMEDGVACGVKAAELYYKESSWKEAFELLRRVDQSIGNSQAAATSKAGMRYQTTKERLQMYIKLRKSESALSQVKAMETYVAQTNDESLRNDLLYNKTIYFYTFGQTAQGNAMFKEMATKLMADGDYDKVDQVYRTLLTNARQTNNVSMLDQTYSSYLIWKDSVAAIKTAVERDSLKQQIQNNEQIIAEKDDSLSARQLTIAGLVILVVILAVVLILGVMLLMRYIATTRKQKKTIQQANESNALKTKFIGNISAQLEPTLKKLDATKPEVKALLDFSEHIQTLSDVENTDNIEFEETQVLPICEKLIEEIKPKLADSVTLAVAVPKVDIKIHKEFLTHILRHLLNDAVEFVPADGKISLELKKRNPHTYQFLITNTGVVIPEEKREEIFKPFLEIKDLTTGDGLGLPICKQMALKMNGDLNIDSSFTKGTRFILNLHV